MKEILSYRKLKRIKANLLNATKTKNFRYSNETNESEDSIVFSAYKQLSQSLSIKIIPMNIKSIP